jgi:hypothetical protein
VVSGENQKQAHFGCGQVTQSEMLIKFMAMKSIRPLSLCITGGLLAVHLSTCQAGAAEATNQWNVQVVGLMVVAPEGGKDNRSFCWKPGVTVSASLTLAAGKIVDLNQEESKLISFTDDKGTDLMAAPASQDPFNKPGLSFESSATGTGGVSSVIFDLKASGQPAQGATRFNIAGSLSAKIAGGTKQFTVENVEMKTNSAFTLGDLPLKISNVGTNRNAWMAKDYKHSVTFYSAHDLASISGLEFYDAQGNKIDARKSSWGGGFGGYMVEYNIKETVDRVKIVATCWQDLKTVTVPITIQTGVGLGNK